MGRFVGHRGTRTAAGLRFASGVAAALLAAAGAVLLAPAPAHAQGADHISITGIGLKEPLEVPAEQYPDLCANLYREVSWLVKKRPDADEPEPDTLGPQYTLVANVEGEPKHRFHLYPLAEGGPRVFRPAEQPGDREVREGWFFGRVSLPETLATAGVPVLDGGAAPGVGGGLPAPEETPEAQRSPLAFLDEWRQGMQLTVALTLAIVAGLGIVALLIRRKV